MSLTSALSIGRSGLLANQAALEVAGNNLANAATAGYTRQTAILTSAGGVQIEPGIFTGIGVKLKSIIRNVDTALQGRLWTAISDQQAAATRHELLSQIESIQNELGTTGLSGQLNEFFGSWSELANDTSQASLRTLVVAQGGNLAESVRNIRTELTVMRGQVDDAIRGAVSQVDSILDEIADLNQRIINAEAGLGGANGLRDQRDMLINQLAEFVDVSTFEKESGSVDIFSGGTALVLGTESRGLKVDFTTEPTTGELEIKVRVESDGTFVVPSSGKLGELIDARETVVADAIESLDEFAGQLIWQVNRVHSQGQGAEDFDSVTGTYEVADSSVSLTDVDAELDFVPGHGSFEIQVTQLSTNPPSTVTSGITVDLDGIGGPDMSLDDLVAAIDAVANISASVTSEGKIAITADSTGFRFSFSDDTSGVLAALGINTYFTGKDGEDIGINAVLDDPAKLATGGIDPITGNWANNGTALAIQGLGELKLNELGGMSLTEMWSGQVEQLAVRTAQASLNVASHETIVGSLQSQRENISGVSVDEEAINLMAFQRAYQGSARFLNVVDQLMETLLSIIR